MRRTVLLVLALVAALALAGCGGGDDDGDAAEPTPAATTEAGGGGEGDPAAGEGVFASAGCGGCHTLEAAGSNGATGPNLDELQPSFEAVVEQVTNGGGGMPAFGDRLSEEEIRNVAAFVAESTAG
jgi:mono/diheme cytochrome c family protein